jgi:hypothetical protein
MTLAELHAKMLELLTEINKQKKESGQSEKGRLLAIAATDLEKSSWAVYMAPNA